MKTKAAIDWHKVETLMGKCIRGSGCVPTSGEFRLLESALAQDPVRYRESHARLVQKVGREMMGGHV